LIDIIHIIVVCNVDIEVIIDKSIDIGIGIGIGVLSVRITRRSGCGDVCELLRMKKISVESLRRSELTLNMLNEENGLICNVYQM
jgi:hypothetical protein